jgi:hypothetical protein
VLEFRVHINKEALVPDRQRLLELALKGLEAERANIDDEIAQIKSQFNPRPAVAKSVATASPATPPKKKTMSAEARRKISEAMKRRYAELNKTAKMASGGSRTAPQVSPSSGKKQTGGSHLTAAGRKKLSDLMKKRWALRRKGKTK